MGLLVRQDLPSGDDFCRGRLLPLIRAVPGWHASSSAAGYVADSWVHWTGRWLAMLVETTVLTSVDITRLYALTVIGVWIVLVACLTIIVREFFGALTPSRVVAAVTLAFCLLYWSAIPGPGDGLFWFTGAVENLLPVALGGAVVALLARSLRVQQGRGALRTAAAFGALIVPGLHELHGLALCAALTLGALLAVRRGRDVALPWALCALLAVIGSAVVIVAPGNGVRAGFYPAPHLTTALGLTVRQLVWHLPRWIGSVPLLAGTMALALDRSVRTVQPAWIATYLPGPRLLLIPALTLGLVTVGLLGPSYAMSSPAPTRTLSGVYLVFLLGWFVTVFAATRGLAASLRIDRTADALAAALGIVFAASVVVRGNTRVGVSDLRHFATPWHASMEARYAMLRATADRGATVIVPAASRPPSVFFAADITESPTAWRNACVAGYFGIAAVALPHDGRSTPVADADARSVR